MASDIPRARPRSRRRAPPPRRTSRPAFSRSPRSASRRPRRWRAHRRGDFVDERALARDAVKQRHAQPRAADGQTIPGRPPPVPTSMTAPRSGSSGTAEAQSLYVYLLRLFVGRPREPRQLVRLYEQRDVAPLAAPRCPQGFFLSPPRLCFRPCGAPPSYFSKRIFSKNDAIV